MDLERHVSIKRCLHDNLAFTKTQISHLVQRSLDNYDVDSVEYFDLRDDQKVKQYPCIFKHAFIPCGNCSIEKQTSPNTPASSPFHRANLSFRIEEIKNISHKKFRYFCYLWIDNELVWKTTTKTNQNNSGNVCWFEKLDFRNVPKFRELRLEIYQKKEVKKLSRRGSLSTLLNPVNYTRNSFKDRGTYEILGSILFNWDFLMSINSIDDWFNVMRGTMNENNTSTEINPRLRVNIDFTYLTIQPLDNYTSLREIIIQHSAEVFKSLEQIVSAQVKDNLSRCCVKLFDYHNSSCDNISAIILEEITNQSNASMIFRQNSFSSKLAENYMKINGDEYLKLLMSDLIKRIVDQKMAWEVDPSKFVSNSQPKCSFLMTPVQSGVDPIKDSLVNPKTNQLNGYSEKVIRDYCVWNSSPTMSCKLIEKSKLKTPWLSTHLILANQLSIENLFPNAQIGNHHANQTTHYLSNNNNNSSQEPLAFTMNANGDVCPSLYLINAQCTLLQYLDLLWRAVQLSVSEFPMKLLNFFVKIRETLELRFGSEVCNKIISSCLFLRFICPAIMSPSLFNILSTYPTQVHVCRNLTILSKALLSLTNLNLTNEKEPYMSFLNVYIECQSKRVDAFLRSISTNDTLDDSMRKEPYQKLTDSLTSSSGLTTSSSSRNSHKIQRNSVSDERIILAELHHVLVKSFQTNFDMKKLGSGILRQLFDIVLNLEARTSCKKQVEKVKSHLTIGSLVDTTNQKDSLDKFSHSHSMNKIFTPNSTDSLKGSIYRESDYDEPFNSSSEERPISVDRYKSTSPIYDFVANSVNEDDDTNHLSPIVKATESHSQTRDSYQIYENVENFDIQLMSLKKKNVKDVHKKEEPRSPCMNGQLSFKKLNTSYRNLTNALESLGSNKKLTNGHRSSIDLFQAEAPETTKTSLNSTQNSFKRSFRNKSFKDILLARDNAKTKDSKLPQINNPYEY